ncbi:hypothetical protein SCLCIDRAFT_876882 [Scleroderma citrinum Foug A]|uniref:DUF6533 domain-containing protein n=1 Tax=Scleroderma citrinum Foug A TaxID=1036808 RepID=A0A0C3A9J1_9AGAM|nr:hypothetical protein SCLCIDRAFT_876882 [Scleroderma citrinum Foug A]
MAIVAVGSPIPADQLGSLEPLIAAEQTIRRIYLAITVFLFYDFFLTINQEIEYIWKYRWNPTSTLYIFVRFPSVYMILATSDPKVGSVLRNVVQSDYYCLTASVNSQNVQWFSTCCATEIQIFRCDYLAPGRVLLLCGRCK